VAPSLTFLGAAGTVTGAKFLRGAGAARRRVLLESWLFQGLPHLRERNWAAPKLELSRLGAVRLSHAHIAHADPGEILRWLRGFERPPAATWAVHGEPEAAPALRDAVEPELHWGGCGVARDGARVEV
jgi:Cft2 family RNA processing exonuclease